ncbi:hypothetical protein [Flavonifractor hominis]|uniref:Uncharacterized protein n=1 Tax=Flavonifractor hominis TaxID=3133178 RepID=A0ABV1ELQ5_9FIRM
MKARRFLSLMCASCIVFSMAVGASATSIEDDPYYCGVDWSQVDTSMCISGTEYHRYEQPSTSLLSADRAAFSGWVKGVPANASLGTSQYALVTDLTFEEGESGTVEVTFTDSQDLSKSDVNISIYDKDDQLITDYFSLAYNSKAPVTALFHIDPTHEYDLFISHQGTGLQNERIVVKVG